ncbi:methyltransferase [Nocardioides sp. GXQ0305]|uniref:methyltransferase n=1 Tax=Nocardioides sp. GXQ0305 TaxID=3423912 RepID=UPI003D7D86E8
MPVMFDDLTIHYDARILRPRPWTAEQARWAAELAVDAPAGDALELCTGAGHIGLLLAALSGRHVVAVDVDPVAGEYARANARRSGLTDRFAVRVGRMDAVLDTEERFGVVIADPPWVPRGETGRYPEDPLLAIDGGSDGLEVARGCLAVAERHLLPGGSLVLQLGTEAQAGLLVDALPERLRHREMRTCPGGVLLHLGTA